MQTPELTNTQALIDRYYTEEKAKKEQALTRASLDIQLDANDLAMLNIIAKRFDKARDELAKDILSNALVKSPMDIPVSPIIFCINILHSSSVSQEHH